MRFSCGRIVPMLSMLAILIPFTAFADSQVTTFAGGGSVFSTPSGIAITPAGDLIVADNDHHQIKRVSQAGVVTVLAGTGVLGSLDGAANVAQFKSPVAVAYDAPRSLIYVADTQTDSIRKIDGGGIVTTFAATGFADPSGLTVDANGNVYVADTGNNKIKKITPAGVVTTIAGTGAAALLDGAALSAKFKNPYGLAITAAGVLYIADQKNHVIRKLENGNVTTIAGTGSNGLVDGAALSAKFTEPKGITFDSSGNLIVADSNNEVIRLVTLGANSTVSTIAGTGALGLVNGVALASKFREPSGVVFNGTIYVADTGNNVIRAIAQNASPTGLAITPAVVTLNPGATVQLSAQLSYSDGTTSDVTASAAWTSSAANIASVSSGLVSAVATGNATITAMFQGQTANITITVPAVPTRLTVAPATVTINHYDTTALMATLTYSDGTTTNVTATAAWTSSATAVASVDAGTVTGNAPGTATVTARASGLTGSATVTVVATPQSLAITPASTYLNPGQTAQLTATATYSDNTTRNVSAQASWTSAANATATVSTTGLVTAVGQGLASITATLQTLTASASLAVNPSTSCDTLYIKDTALWLLSDGSQPRQVLQDPQGIVMPRLSPSGSRVVYQRAASDDPATAPLLVVADSATGTVVTTVSPAGLPINALLQLGWRYDDRIYLVGHVNPSASLYYELDPQSGLFNGEDASSRFSVSPDGNFIIRDEFVPHGAPAPFDTSVAELNGDRVYPPSSDGGYHRFALTYAWAHDASRVAFVDTRPLEGTSAIVILRAADGVVVSQTTLPDGVPPSAIAWTTLNQLVFRVADAYYQLDSGGTIVPLASPPNELEERFVVDIDGEFPAEDQRCQLTTAGFRAPRATGASSRRSSERTGISITTARKSIPVGEPVVLKISIPHVAGRGGAIVHLSCKATGIHMPSIVVIPEGHRSAMVTIQTTSGVVGQIIQVYASTESSRGSMLARIIPIHSSPTKEQRHE